MRLGRYLTKTIGDHNNKIQFCFNVVTERMATKANQEPIKEENLKIKEEEEEAKSKKTLPPPPEKPEPGDCCGSGCVRCVWDVYYDELDAYNKLYKCDDSNGAKN